MSETLKTLDKPWSKLAEDIKQWARDNNYVIRESDEGVTVFSDWKDEYIRQHTET